MRLPAQHTAKINWRSDTFVGWWSRKSYELEQQQHDDVNQWNILSTNPTEHFELLHHYQEPNRTSRQLGRFRWKTAHFDRFSLASRSAHSYTRSPILLSSVTTSDAKITNLTNDCDCVLFVFKRVWVLHWKANNSTNHCKSAIKYSLFSPFDSATHNDYTLEHTVAIQHYSLKWILHLITYSRRADPARKNN